MAGGPGTIASDARVRTLATCWEDERDPEAPLSVLARTGAIAQGTAAVLERDLHLLDLAAGSEDGDAPGASRAQLQALLVYVQKHGERGPRSDWQGLRDDLLFTDPETIGGWTLAQAPKVAGANGLSEAAAEELPPPAPGTWHIDPLHSSVNFSARHLKLSNVRCRFDTFEGAVEVAEPLDGSVVYVAIATRSIDTGVRERDDHLRSPDFLDVERFPTMGFVSNGIKGDGSEWSLDGQLTIRDVTRPVTLAVTYHGVAPDPTAGTDRMSFSARTAFLREDYGLTWSRPLEAGQVLIGSEILVELDIVAAHEPPPTA